MAEPTITRGEDYFFTTIYEGTGFGQKVGNFVPFTDSGTIAKSCLFNETDSPYLAPVPHRGKSNEPAFVSFIAKKGAEVLDVDEDFFRNQTTKNFFTLFKKAF